MIEKPTIINQYRMYKVKPIIEMPSQLVRSNIMYEMKTIDQYFEKDQRTNTSDTTTYAIDENSQLRLSALENRQEKVLELLNELKCQVEKLCDSVKLAPGTDLTYGFNDVPMDHNLEPVKVELIVYANPAHPPHSLMVLESLWKDTLFNLKTYQHSSIANPAVVDFNKSVENCNNVSKNIVDVTLIWKEVADLQVITEIGRHHFENEINLLRYLSRSIKSCNYEKLFSVNELIAVDAILDLCCVYQNEPFHTASCSLILALCDILKTGPWLFDKNLPSIVDAAVWSTLKNSTTKKLPREIDIWIKRCEKAF